MEERPETEIPASPQPPSQSAQSQFLGVLVGFAIALVPAGWAMVTAGGLIGKLFGRSGVLITIGLVLAIALVGAGVLAVGVRREARGFFRGMLIGAALSLLITGGSLSWLLWVCRKGW